MSMSKPHVYAWSKNGHLSSQQELSEQTMSNTTADFMDLLHQHPNAMVVLLVLIFPQQPLSYGQTRSVGPAISKGLQGQSTATSARGWLEGEHRKWRLVGGEQEMEDEGA
jgi:hypothetical protein